MNLDERVGLVTALGPASFKQVAVAFLRARFRCVVQYTDGTGDGGVDAWVVLSEMPLVRVPAQFYAGDADGWRPKLLEDVAKLATHRDQSSSERRADFGALFFVCTARPSATAFEILRQEVRSQYQVDVTCFDARAIADQASQDRHLMQALAAELPGAVGPALTARDEALLTFGLFHDAPNRFRWAVVKAAITTVLHRNGGAAAADLPREAADLLGLDPASVFLHRTIRNLQREGLLTEDCAATEGLLAEAAATLAIASEDRRTLVAGCAEDLAPLFRKGTHNRDERALRLAEGLADDLGALVRASVVEQAVRAVDRSSASRDEHQAAARLRAVRNRVAAELPAAETDQAIAALLARAAADPFARRLAAAELFVRLTALDDAEFALALRVPRLRVVFDASVAMPLLCSCFDRIAEALPASVEAAALHRSLSERGAAMILPGSYLEEVAAHLLEARSYASAIGADPALARSRNYFVAHFCSTSPAEGRTDNAFRQFLRDLGGNAIDNQDFWAAIRQAERELRRHFERYGIRWEDMRHADADSALPNEPARPPVVLRHDRVIVRALMEAAEPSVLCTADAWLQGVCADLGMTALDSGALVDLLALIAPAGIERPLVSHLAVALSADPLQAAADVWDTVVSIEKQPLDRVLIRQAKEFRDVWLAQRRADLTMKDLGEAWREFRSRLPQ